MKRIVIDRSKRLYQEPHTGHNRWHPDILPIVEVNPGETIALETRDALDGQIKPGMSTEDLLNLDAKVAHPLTGPVFVKGAEPGDLLEIETVDIIPEPFGWTRIRPGAGFLRDLFPVSCLYHWKIENGWGHIGPDSGGAYSRRFFYGHIWYRPFTRAASILDPSRSRSCRPWWHCNFPRSRRRRTGRRIHRARRAQNRSTSGKRRQYGCQTIDQGLTPSYPGQPKWCALLHRGCSFCTG